MLYDIKLKAEAPIKKHFGLALLVLLIGACSKLSELNSFFKENSVDLQLPETFVIKSKTLQPLLVLAEDKASDEVIKVQIKVVKDYPDALNEAKKSTILIASQFEFTMAPYPGQITEATNCGNKFKPKILNNYGLSYVAAFSNERLALSICEGDDFKYQTLTSFYINPDNTQLLVVDYYSSSNVQEDVKVHFLSQKLKNFKNINLDSFKILIR